MQRGKCIMNLISQYKGLRKENYVLCFGRFVTAMGAMVRPMLTMILSQKLGMNAVQVAWITALMGILTIPANLIGGKMADRFNKKMNIVYLDMISVISYIICGLIPLVFATGAGALGNRSIGTAAAGGMLVGTLVGIFLVPGLYMLFEALETKMKRKKHNDSKKNETQPNLV